MQASPGQRAPLLLSIFMPRRGSARRVSRHDNVELKIHVKSGASIVQLLVSDRDGHGDELCQVALHAEGLPARTGDGRFRRADGIASRGSSGPVRVNHLY